jgi:hypothetical protein
MERFLQLVAVALLIAGPATAVCSVPQPRLVCAEYFASQVVVEATLIRTKIVRDKDDPEGVLGRVYGLRADRILRGNLAAGFRVYEGNDSGRASFGWKTGQKYLLFLVYSVHDKSWVLDGCGNSGPLNQSKAVLAQIDAIHAHHDGGVVYGVVSEQALSVPVPGVRVEVRGGKQRYTATTNAQGEFQVEVPVGRYSVRAMRTGLSFDTADLSYENPHGIRIEPGGCAQVQLAAGARSSHVPKEK